MKNLRDIKACMKEALEKDGLTNIIEVKLPESDITSFKTIAFKGDIPNGGSLISLVSKVNNEATVDKSYLVMYRLRFKERYIDNDIPLYVKSLLLDVSDHTRRCGCLSGHSFTFGYENYGIKYALCMPLDIKNKVAETKLRSVLLLDIIPIAETELNELIYKDNTARIYAINRSNLENKPIRVFGEDYSNDLCDFSFNIYDYHDKLMEEVHRKNLIDENGNFTLTDEDVKELLKLLD